MELLSLHVPKCAGSSLREALLTAYGKERVYLDYTDRLLDPASPANRDTQGFLREFKKVRDFMLTGKEVAHGHFAMRKYEGIEAVRATFLRHPVMRLVSHYFFWAGFPPHGHTLHDQFLREKPSLSEFARWPGMRYFYSQIFFRGVDMASFDIIGRTEELPAGIARLEQLIGRRLNVTIRNETKAAGYQQKKGDIEADTALQAELHDILAEDIAFYEQHTT